MVAELGTSRAEALGEFNGRLQTVVTRCKVVEVVEEPEAAAA